jgi:hypothetical protein
VNRDALADKLRRVRRRIGHGAVSQWDLESIDEVIGELEREETPCASALIPGVIVCYDLDTGRPRRHGHAPPHTGRGPTGSRVTWTSEEATTNG